MEEFEQTSKKVEVKKYEVVKWSLRTLYLNSFVKFFKNKLLSWVVGNTQFFYTIN